MADDPPDPPAGLAAEVAGDREVSLTNLDKVFWPGEGYTKGDLIEYYRAVAPWLMPYMRDRPVVLTRYPDGIEGKSFYQKDAKSWVPDWIRTITVWSEHSQREIHYFICDQPEAVAYLANLGSIPLHIWSSRASDLSKPDWCILDLDPKGAPFTDVVILARAIHKLCSKIGLESFVKTSGSTRLHVLIPLGRQCTFEHSRALGQLIASAILIDHGDIATTARAVGGREGKVYLDFLQNRHGQLLAAPFSVRPLPGAPVSVPLKWSEVTKKLEPQRYTIKNVLPRLQRMKEEPMLPVLDLVPDLTEALARLSEVLGPAK
jgi:bifunctional non-homologous end joining protein LigD